MSDYYRINYLIFIKPRQRGRSCGTLKCQHIFRFYYSKTAPTGSGCCGEVENLASGDHIQQNRIYETRSIIF